MPDIDASTWPDTKDKLLARDKAGEVYQGLAPRPELCLNYSLGGTGSTLSIDTTTISVIRVLPTGTVSVVISNSEASSDAFLETTEFVYICNHVDSLILTNNGATTISIYTQAM